MSGAAVGGIVAAAAAAACFDGGLALQALDAREVPVEHGLRPTILGRLLRRRRWLAATGLAIGGWPFHLAALAMAPLSLVQPTLALGLVLLLYLGRTLLHEPVGRTEMLAVAGVVGSVGILAWAAPAESAHHAGPARIALGLVPLGVVGLLPLAAPRLRVMPPSAVLPFAAGAAYAFTGVSSKLLVDDVRVHAWGGAALWIALTGVFGLAGLIIEMSALQVRPATYVGPNVFVVQFSVPVLLAPLVSGESWANTPLAGGVILLSVAATAVSAVVLARSPAVAAFSNVATD